MGGGGAMRAAAKVAGFGVNGGLRGAPSVPLPEHPVTIASRKASRPVAGIVSSPAIEDGKSAVLLSSQNCKIDASASVQRPSWEIDEWEFAGDEEELFVDSMHPMPRVIFGGVPTLEEAKEATSDLKDALEKVYFPSNATGCRNSSPVVQESLISVPGYSETKACVTSESVVPIPSVPKPAFQAFSLLKEHPQAQSVVASLAADKNVWDAVMQNEKVMEFLEQQRTISLPPDMDMDVKEPFADNESHDDHNSSKGFYDEADAKHCEDSGNAFMEFMQKVKLTVTDMVSNLSGFFQSIFGSTAAENVSMDSNGNAMGTNVDKTIGASFMALAVLAIMVVVLKRG